MKLTIKQLLLAICLLINTISFGQAPQKFNYQGIARDAKGNPIAKQKMSLKISVLPTQDATVAEYEETQEVTTNEFGLYTLQIGGGTIVSGEMKTVKWETGNKYIKVAIDQKGGTDFVEMGTSQLLSVPYAIYADKAGMARETVATEDKTRTGAVSSNAAHVAGDANYLTKFTGLNTIGKSQIFDNGTHIGIGTNTPPIASSNFKFTVQSTGEVNSVIKTTTASSMSIFRIWNSNNKGFEFYQAGSTNAGTFLGLPRANMSFFTANSGTLAYTALTDIAFGTGAVATAVPRLIIKGSTGNVGIGTITPTTSLDVVSPTYYTTRFKNTNTSDRTTLIGLENNNTTPSTWFTGVGGVGNGLGLTKGEYYLEQQGQGARMIIDSNGVTHFGVDAIGNSNSWYRLAVTQPNAGYGSAMYLQTADAGNTVLDGAQISLENGINPAVSIINRESGGIRLGTNSSYNAINILDNGNVGIGTSSPSDKLQVLGGITTGNNSTQQGRLTLLPTNGSAFFHMLNNNDNTLRISQGASAGLNDLVSISASGPVTIGSAAGTSLGNLVLNTQSTTIANPIIRANVGIGVNSLGMTCTGSWLRFLSSNDNFATSTDEVDIYPGLAFHAATDNSKTLGTSSYRWTSVYAVNGTIQTSDMRLKTNVTDLNYGLADIMKIKPISYNWKSDADGKRKVGFSAQELEKVMPELVYHEEMSEKMKADFAKEGKTLPTITDPYGVNYADMAPILVKAIQEQQKLIEELKKEIELLKSK